MRAGRWSIRGPWLLLSLLVAGCSSSPGDDDTPGDTPGDDDDMTPTQGVDVEAGLTIDAVSALTDPPGHYTIDFTLTGNSGLSATMKAEYSFDQLNYKTASVSSVSLSNLSVSPTGESHRIQWDSLEDLGFITKKVYFRLSGSASGYEFPPTLASVQVDNTGYDKPCSVTIDQPTSNDGDIPLTYTLRDELGDVCDVTIQIQRGEQTAAATASVVTASDPLNDVEVPATGIVRTFVWDSLADVKAFNETVVVKITAKDANKTSEDSVTIDVRNDPTPAAGDVVISEIFFYQDVAAYSYLELYNATGHTVNLRDLDLKTTTNSGTTTNPVLVISPGLDLFMPSGALFIVSNSLITAQDLFTAEYVASGMTLLKTTEAVELSLADGTLIDRVTYAVADYGGKDAVRGHSLALSWDMLSADENDFKESWCLEDIKIPTTDSDSDFGSPHEPTHCGLAALVP